MDVREILSTAIDTLLSHTAHSRHAAAFASLAALFGRLVAEPPNPVLLDAFLTLQDSFEHNLSSALLAWLGTSVWQQQQQQKHSQSSDDRDAAWSEITLCLGLLQGVLLLHLPSQRLFARRSALEHVLAVLAFSRPSHLSSPALPSSSTVPSPVLLPPSPAPPALPQTPTAPSSTSTPATNLALAALDTLLCALVDRPRNLRTFEDVGGLPAIVKVLKDKSVAQVVRIKVVEILYLYLLPERPSRRSESSSPDHRPSTPPPLPDLLAASVLDFVPQTPMKPRRPLTPIVSPVRSRTPLLPIEKRKSRSTSRRSEEEKRELLRAVMPNVEALEHRFRALGLGHQELNVVRDARID